ncbi:ER membrane DUF1077 domain protein [Pseudohyphozyma bogoriensis]|nr:ER membrane DUF1077 domain protein [Pseudohyphozyma bogoriensis]
MSRWSVEYPTVSTSKVADPPGYTPALTKSSRQNATSLIKKVDLAPLRQQKAWEIGLAPAKNVPMQAFMMYMTGGGVQIFSVMSVWGCLKGAVSGILATDKTFASLSGTAKPLATDAEKPSFLLQKAAFVACQIGLLLVALWKINSMGLLPTETSDWLAWKEMPTWTETTRLAV